MAISISRQAVLYHVGRGVDHPSPSSAKVKERVELYVCSTSEPSWPVLGFLPLHIKVG